VTDRR